MSEKETKVEKKVVEGFSHRWRQLDLHQIHDEKEEGFLTKLKADEMVKFEFMQDCNMGGSYIRCFFQLKDGTLFEQVPLETPNVHWVKPGNKMTRVEQEDKVWQLIDKQFDCVGGRPYTCVFLRKT